MISNHKLTAVCKKLAKEGGLIAWEKFNSHEFTQKFKEDSSYVTTVDEEVEAFISSGIVKEFPSHIVVGEEHPDNSIGEYYWYVDPIDGTSNFLLGIPLFATMIGVVHQNQVIASAIYSPSLDKLFWAEKGVGAYMNDTKIKPSTHTLPFEKTTLLVEGGGRGPGRDKLYSFLEHHGKKYRSLRKYGSLIATCLLLEQGQLQVYLQFQSGLYDCVPPSLICSEAGLAVTDLEGNEWSVTNGDNMIVTHPKITKKVVEQLCTL